MSVEQSIGEQKESKSMPIGTQSLVPYTQTIFTAVNGTQYKGAIDAATAIAGNSAGSLCVYPNSPAALSVLVDDAWNIPSVGSAAAFLLNAGSSANTVTVVVPGSNSYYGCVYWDAQANSPGVIYGPSAVSPVPVVPDQFWRIPLAFVLISSVQTTITATNILDARFWINPVSLSVYVNGTTNPTVNCNNASGVFITYNLPAATTTLNLSNLRIGIPVILNFANNSGANRSVSVTATAPSGATYSVTAATAGGTSSAFTAATLVSTGNYEYPGYTITDSALALRLRG